MQVNGKKVMEMIDKIKTYGGSVDKGVTRLAYSAEDLAAQEYVIGVLQELGCSVRRDVIGNIFARLEGKEAGLAAIATGSHLDSVKQAGPLDGVLGVVAAVEVMRLAKKKGLRHPVETIIFMAEESTRFGFATMGSKLMAGIGSPQGFCKAAKAGEKNYIEVLEDCGFKPAEYESARINPADYRAFLELHIEQGRVLADSHESIGVVENIAAPTRMKITVEGMADHSGATPMGFRKDALVTGARLIVKIEEIARAHADEGIVATVGVVDIEPGSINVIPGKVTLWVDLRGVEQESILTAVNELHDAVADIAEADNIKVVTDVLTADKPVALSKELADISAQVCEDAHIAYRRMNSGAGHDAMHLATIIPTTMIFVPSIDGISHNPAEYTRPEDIELGVKVLWETICRIDKE